jgi:hypothetical protein
VPQITQDRVISHKQDQLLGTDSLAFTQINTHHCKAAMVNLSPYIHNNKVDVLIIQEPYCYNKEPCYIPPDYLAFFAPSDKNPRASLLIQRNTAHKFMFLHQFTNPDNATVVTATNPPIHIASSYHPPTTCSNRTSQPWRPF